MYTRCRSSGRGKCGAARSARGSMGTLFSEVCLLRVAACCSVLQRVAACCSVLQRVAVCCSVLQRVAVCCSELQCVAACVKSSMSTLLSEVLPRGSCSVLPCVAACCHVLQRVAMCCSVFQARHGHIYWRGKTITSCHVMSRHSYKEVVSRTVRLSETVGGGGGGSGSSMGGCVCGKRSGVASMAVAFFCYFLTFSV